MEFFLGILLWNTRNEYLIYILNVTFNEVSC